MPAELPRMRQLVRHGFGFTAGRRSSRGDGTALPELDELSAMLKRSFEEFWQNLRESAAPAFQSSRIAGRSPRTSRQAWRPRPS